MYITEEAFRGLVGAIETASQVQEELRREIAVLRKALAFYADENSYPTADEEFGDILTDCGQRARDALGRE